ncbi:hypothetical protein F2P81_021920 [Scophthalmus maximus]|uniref:Ras-related protein Rab-37-like n=1 Tax=Scophthalmus maximus TaxID=52904 RepID=A0A6A4RXJ2_SCOMX|nr:hypothetical protein F2P81_021920 [Scophthalmus maximus]
MERMERMERTVSMEPISAFYTTAYPEIQPDSAYGCKETESHEAKTPPAPTYDEESVHKNKVVTVDDVKVKLQIWDTAGQERFRSVTHAYYRDAHDLLLLYDITSRSSFDNIRAWLTEIHEYAQSDVVIMLLGNKYSVPFMETSAMTGVNVELAFTAVAKELKHRAVQHPNEPKFQIHEYIEAQKEKSGCCSSF